MELWCALPGTDVTCVHRSQSSRHHRFSSCRHGRIRLMFPWFEILYWYATIQRYVILSTESMVRRTKNGQIKWTAFDITATCKTQNCILSQRFSPETCALSRLTGVGFHCVSTIFPHRFRALFRSSWSPRSSVWAKTVCTRAKCVPNIAHVWHADWMIFRHLSAM